MERNDARHWLLACEAKRRAHLMLIMAEEVESADRDQAARSSVYQAYAKLTSAGPQAKFEAALVAYCAIYPEISAWDARHHVAHILATRGMR